MPDANPNYTLDDIAHLVSQSQPKTQPQTSAKSRDGKAMLAVGAAAVWPGLGHLLFGHVRWAIAYCMAAICLILFTATVLFEPRLLPTMIVVLPLGIIFQLSQMLHASSLAKRSRCPIIDDPSSRYCIGLVLAFIGFGECYGTVHYLQNNYVEICYTPTDSMGPNISPGDFFLNFRQATYHRWDIVGINTPGSEEWHYPRLCKRLVGLPNETVEITGPALMINGKPAQIPAHAGPYIPIDFDNNPLLDSEPMSDANGCWGRPITLGPD
jgi:signal peptidase I